MNISPIIVPILVAVSCLAAQAQSGTVGFIMKTGTNRLHITHVGVLQEVLDRSSDAPAYVAVWSTKTGALLGSILMRGGEWENGYRKAELGAPIDLAPKTSYTVGVSTGPYVLWGNAQSESLPSVKSNFTITHFARSSSVMSCPTQVIETSGVICPMVWTTNAPFSGIPTGYSGIITLQTSTNLETWDTLTNFTFTPPDQPGRFFRMRVETVPVVAP
jgi:hypothetical protein